MADPNNLKVEEAVASVEAKVIDAYHNLVELAEKDLAKVKVFVEKLLARSKSDVTPLTATK